MAAVIGGLLVLLLCQLAGEVTVRLTGLALPGPVVGMLVFLVVLRLRRPTETSTLVEAPAALLGVLQLLFVPAGVGVVVYLSTLRDDALPIAGGLWLSWCAGLAVTGWVVAGLLKVVRR
jgi:holin-like protein